MRLPMRFRLQIVSDWQKKTASSDFYDKLTAEEDALKSWENLNRPQRIKVLEAEIHESIRQINDEGRVLKEERDALVEQADPEF